MISFLSRFYCLTIFHPQHWILTSFLSLSGFYSLFKEDVTCTSEVLSRCELDPKLLTNPQVVHLYIYTTSYTFWVFSRHRTRYRHKTIPTSYPKFLPLSFSSFLIPTSLSDLVLPGVCGNNLIRSSKVVYLGTNIYGKPRRKNCNHISHLTYSLSDLRFSGETCLSTVRSLDYLDSILTRNTDL